MPPGQELGTGVYVTDRTYFETMQIPLKHGRLYTEQEATEMRHVVVVNETFVRKNLNGEDPLGKRIIVYMKDENVPTEIIGVVADQQARRTRCRRRADGVLAASRTRLHGNDVDAANAR